MSPTVDSSPPDSPPAPRVFRTRNPTTGVIKSETSIHRVKRPVSQLLNPAATAEAAAERSKSLILAGPIKKWDRDKMLSDAQKRFLQDFFHKEPCPYGHRVFKHSSVLFGILKHDLEETNSVVRRQKSEEAKQKLAELEPLDYHSRSEQRASFHLTFSTLKYQKFLQDMLEDCAFFSEFVQFREDIDLVMVMMCDLKLRKFQLRQVRYGEEIDPYLSDIEGALFSCKTKLNAALARSRIKACVLTVDHLLPESVRQNDRFASKMNINAWVNFTKTKEEQIAFLKNEKLSAWVNLCKTSMSSVFNSLQLSNFKQVDSDLKLRGRTYYLDHHCSDVIVFAGEMRELLEGDPLTQDGHLVIQDKSSCLGPQSVRNLINLGDDIMHINLGSGLTMAHMASLTHGSDSVIFGFGVQHDKHYQEVMKNMELTGCKGRVRVIQEDLLDVNLEDERFKHIKVVLVSADCSRSGVANPVDFIVSEGEDMGILKDLSLGSLDEMRLSDLVVQHNNVMRHAMRFPRVQAVVYCTRSLNEAENENVVTRSIEYVNTVQSKKTPFRLAPPVLPLTDRDIESENPLVGKYLKFMPSPNMSGCFVATITREADDPKQAAKDILARAAARGIISGVPTVDKKKKPKPKKEKVEKPEKKKEKPPPKNAKAAKGGGKAKKVEAEEEEAAGGAAAAAGSGAAAAAGDEESGGGGEDVVGKEEFSNRPKLPSIGGKKDLAGGSGGEQRSVRFSEDTKD